MMSCRTVAVVRALKYLSTAMTTDQGASTQRNDGSANQRRIPVDEAIVALLAQVGPVSDHERVPVLDAMGRTLVEDIPAPADVPPFDYATLDGYAVRASDTEGAAPDQPISFEVVGVVAAGGVTSRPLGKGEAYRIMTGGPLPPGGDAVVPFEGTDGKGFGGWDGSEAMSSGRAQERVAVRVQVQAGADVRRRAEDQRSGEVLLRSGTRVRPAEVAVLASAGISLVWVHRRIRIGVLSTGDELARRDHVGPLGPGKIRDANGPALLALASRDGADTVDLGQARDEPNSVRSSLLKAVDHGCDLIVTSGGVSMGDRDMVKHVIRDEGEVSIWSIDLRPGKPFTFGRFRGVPVMALPGNPVSAMVTYELLVNPVVRRMQGDRGTVPVEVMAIADQEILNDSGRENFVRGVARIRYGVLGSVEWHVRPTGPQGSGILTSMSRANCLIRLSSDTNRVASGGRVRLRLMDASPLW